MALGVVMMLTIKVFGLRWFQTDNIYPLYNPQRWVGYLRDRPHSLWHGRDSLGSSAGDRKRSTKKHDWQDLAFPVLLVLTVLSGLAAHIFRYAGFALTCHFLYALHVIIATPMLLVEMSFGKWSHMVYRPLALYLLAVRQRAGRQIPAAEAVPHAL